MRKRTPANAAVGAFDSYVHSIEKALKSGDATEHTHRPALKTFIEALFPAVTATNEPKRIAAGAPDFNIKERSIPMGHIETKDIGISLDDMIRGKGASAPQFKRYIKGLANWILTDYLDFVWFVDGVERQRISIGHWAGSKVVLDVAAEQKVSALLKAFVAHKATVIKTAKDLAVRLAGMAQILDGLVERTFESETKRGYLHSWYDAVRETLIPDLEVAAFGDMFAQTLVYGLFASKISAKPGSSFTRATAPFDLPRTNPFLRKFFAEIAGISMPAALDWAVEDVIAILDRIDVEAIMADFAKSRVHEDPVVHFYETFLAAYKPRLRDVRGVYYTPRPVVEYIVNSVEEILIHKFGKTDGLAAKDALILDPAVGTATFLYSIIEHIHSRFDNKPGAWQKYVHNNLLPRVFGFELLMAPYAIAHLKLSVQLENLKYEFVGDERLGIYLTNTLEKAEAASEKLLANFIADEARAADEVKNTKPIVVVLGNPPYSGVSENKGDWILSKINDYRYVDGKELGERKVWLQNDYIKFLRFAQWRVTQTGHGVVAFITDNSYLDSPTFRGMRHNLLSSFDEITILNLHGSHKRRETSPDGSKDVNVFDIQQGVSIVFLVKSGKPAAGLANVKYADLYGTREDKYDFLASHCLSNTKLVTLTPSSSSYNFVPVDTTAQAAYDRGVSLKDIFVVGSNGVQTSRDHLVVDFTDNLLEDKLSIFGDATVSDDVVRRKLFNGHTVGDYLPGDMSEFAVPQARVSFLADRKWRKKLRPYQYRPFDSRSIIYADYLIHRPRWDVMRHIAGIDNNLTLCVGRAGLVKAGEWTLAFVTSDIVDHNIFYRGSSQNYPLYVEDEPDLLSQQGEVRHNFHPSYLTTFAKTLGLKFEQKSEHGDCDASFGARDLFCYIYAVLYSPEYRLRYRQFLDMDYPKIPLISSKTAFAQLVALGERLVDLHLMRSDEATGASISYPKSGEDVVEAVFYDDTNQRVYINDAQYFEPVDALSWEMEFGGYQVLEKWLKDRTNYELTYDEIETYGKLVETIVLTEKLSVEIDAVMKRNVLSPTLAVVP